MQDLLGERDQSLPSSSIERVSMDMASALHYLHTEKHILHGDIKSGNVLIVGDCETAKLCDFGVTVPLDNEGKAIQGKVYVGTEAWSPKEVIMGDQVITTKADMFAFGLVIFEMISLHSPHIDKLESMEGEDDEEDFDEEDEAAFMAALGTRPPLPDTVNLDHTYRSEDCEIHNVKMWVFNVSGGFLRYSSPVPKSWLQSDLRHLRSLSCLMVRRARGTTASSAST